MKKIILAFGFVITVAAIAATGWKNNDFHVNGNIESSDLITINKIGNTIFSRTPILAGTNQDGPAWNITNRGGTGNGTVGEIVLRSSIPNGPGTTPHSQVDVVRIVENKIAFHGGVPVAQSAAISNPSGGVVVDIQCRAAVNSILTEMRGRGFVAP